jgi:hypothetical protein
VPGYRRTTVDRMKIHIVALGAAALLGLAACSATGATATLSPEADALTGVGFTSAELAPATDPSPSTDPSAGAASHPADHRPGALRRHLRKNVEHGEVVVRTKDGDKTIDVQRGTVTAITGSSVTVKSTDGFSETWAFGSPLRVLENRATVQPSEVKSGVEVGVAGVKNGSTVTANLIVIPKKS